MKATGWASAAGMALGAALLTGCGASSTPSPPSANPSAPSASVTPSSHSPVVSDFPKIIQTAMKKVPTSIVPTRLAPTILPAGPSHQQEVSSAQTTVSRGKTPGYSVRLISPVGELGSFGATHYSSGQLALRAAETNAHAQASAGRMTGHISLGDHIQGAVRRQSGSAGGASGGGPWTSISWTQGQWSMVVVNHSSTQVLTPVAKEVVSAMRGVHLPPPQQQGFIFVNMVKSGSPIQTAVQWESQGTAYYVNTDTRASNPVRAAIELTASVEAFPASS